MQTSLTRFGALLVVTAMLFGDVSIFFCFTFFSLYFVVPLAFFCFPLHLLYAEEDSRKRFGLLQSRPPLALFNLYVHFGQAHAHQKCRTKWGLDCFAALWWS